MNTADPLQPIEGDHVLAVIFVPFDWGNLLTYVWTRDRVPMASYRFRHYRDDKIFDSDDEKSWYTVTGRDDGEELLQALSEHALAIAIQFRSLAPPQVVRVDGDIVRMLSALAEQPWANIEIGVTANSRRSRGRHRGSGR